MTMTTEISMLPSVETAPRESASGVRPFGPFVSILLVLAIMIMGIAIAFAVAFVATGLLHGGGWQSFLDALDSPEEATGLAQLGERFSWLLAATWSFLLIPLIVALAAIRGGGGIRRLLAINFSVPLKPMLWALGFIVLVALVEGRLAEMYPSIQQLFGLAQDPLALAISAVVIMVLAPIGEELVFRGFLYTAFRERWGYAPSLIVVSVLFSAMHFEPTMMYPLLVLPLAFALGWLREKSGGVFAPILLHMIVNDWAFLSTYLTR
ncbi:CPBP family intramembrane glutamic endopeptidase [Flaviflagellibacter deserti]|uniref:CPBP family intramembrane glutamic endopeptidase n=1 Tax=Flaviflagellibacter deserti TaxID=2267266 RepID=A0ABV9Z4X7_9HYPH